MLSSIIVKILDFAALLAVSTLAFGQSPKPPADDNSHVVLNTMAEELQRNFDGMKKKADPPPYFLSYEITDQDSHNISASLGVLNAVEDGRNRYLDVTVRVGDPKLDNFRRVRGERVQFTSGAAVPIDNIPAALRQDLWLETDRVYRASAERLIKIKTNQQVKAADRDTSNDFSSEESYAHWEAPASVTFDSTRWKQSVRDLSKDFLTYPDLLSSDVQVSFLSDTRYFANTEGTKVQHGRGFRPRDHHSQRQGEGRYGCLRLRLVRSCRPERPPFRRRHQGRGKEGRRTCRSPDHRENGRAFCRPRDPVRPRIRCLLSRDLRTPHRRPSPEG